MPAGNLVQVRIWLVVARKRRLRQHVNPLNFREEPKTPNWTEVFPNPHLPLEVDIGSAKGLFLSRRATVKPAANLVGLEIRKPMAERAARKIADHKLNNAHVLCCNANISLAKLFETGRITRAYVHFPDPWFKKKHHKRRLIKPEFLIDLAKVLKIGGELHFATDHQNYAQELLAFMALSQDFSPPIPCQAPFGVMTDREAWHTSQGDPVYRYVMTLKQRVDKAGSLILPDNWQDSAKPPPLHSDR